MILDITDFVTYLYQTNKIQPSFFINPFIHQKFVGTKKNEDTTWT
jgi:hypothetical protein